MLAGWHGSKLSRVESILGNGGGAPTASVDGSFAPPFQSFDGNQRVAES